jgi:hypothetical protein
MTTESYDGSKISIKRIRLNQGGYEYGKYGRYFGNGAPLYKVVSDDYTIDTELRASNHECAKEQVLAKYPNARFYR